MSYFEDVTLGHEFEGGAIRFTEADIREFNATYGFPDTMQDGRLLVSPWHVASAWMGLMIRSRDAEMARQPKTDDPPGGASPGFLDLKWSHPVFAGDLIRYRSTITKKIELKSRPNMGIVRSLNEGFNEDGVCVFSFYGQALYIRRHPAKS